MTDVYFNKLFSYGSNYQSSFQLGIPTFLFLGIIYVVGQYLILQFIRNKSKLVRTKVQLHLNIIHRAVYLIQYGLAALIVFFILEMFTTSAYSTVLLTAAIGVSYILSIVMLGLLSIRFFSWFRSNRDSVVFLYGLASLTLTINAIFTITLAGNSLVFLYQPYIFSHVGQSFVPFITSSLLFQNLNYAYAISSVLSFMATWVATVVILRHYSPNLGKSKYWLLSGFPLAYFLIQILPFFPNILSLLSYSQATFFLLYTFIPIFSRLIGGILFGFALWAVVRKLGKRSAVKDYMIISAYGLTLIFISNQAILLAQNVPYPPFGFVAVSFIGLSSYMLLVGIYSSAISVAEDSKLRQTIRDVATKELRLLDNIGTAQMVQEIQKTVIGVTKRTQETMIEETGVESSITEEDMKQYLEQVINEVKGKAIINKDEDNN
jgi:hypothetical protein